jgi:hypothetical protein
MVILIETSIIFNKMTEVTKDSTMSRPGLCEIPCSLLNITLAYHRIQNKLLDYLTNVKFENISLI